MKRALLLVSAAAVIMVGGVAAASSQAPYPQPPGYVTPYGCYDTTLGADGPQVGATQVATISVTAAQPPFTQHVTVMVNQGYWLVQVRGSWFVWDNEDGVNNRSFETNGYDAPPGIVAVACPWPCLGAPPLPTTSTTLPEPYCAAPPTTHLSLLPPTSVGLGTTSSTASAGSVSTEPSTTTQPATLAVAATPRFTG